MRGLEILHEEAVEVVVDVRVVHGFDEVERVLDAAVEQDAEQLFHDGVVLLGLEAKNKALLFGGRHLRGRRQDLARAHALIRADGVARQLLARSLDAALGHGLLLLGEVRAQERDFFLGTLELRHDLRLEVLHTGIVYQRKHPECSGCR